MNYTVHIDADFTPILQRVESLSAISAMAETVMRIARKGGKA